MIIRILFVDNSYLDIEICSDGIQIGVLLIEIIVSLIAPIFPGLGRNYLWRLNHSIFPAGDNGSGNKIVDWTKRKTGPMKYFVIGIRRDLSCAHANMRIPTGCINFDKANNTLLHPERKIARQFYIIFNFQNLRRIYLSIDCLGQIKLI